MDRLVVQAKAREFLRGCSVQSYPVDVIKLAGSRGFKVKFDQDMAPDQAGCSITLGSKKRMLINDNDLPERKRFTILHEIAHDYLGLPSVHGEGISLDELGTYTSRPEEEIACDLFAAECLVPWFQIRPLTGEFVFDRGGVCDLAELFEASRSVIASRFAQESADQLIFVLSESGVVKNVTASKSVVDAQYWIDVGISVPKGSIAHHAFQGRRDLSGAEYGADVWSTSRCAGKYICSEEVITLPRWKQCLSLISLEDKVAQNSARRSDDLNEDVLLEELSGHLPWPKK